MARRWAILGVVLFLGWGGAAAAAGPDLEFYTGQQLYAQCSAAPADADFQARLARCGGYIMGVSDAIQAAQGAGRAARVCIRPGDSAQQIEMAAQQFLADHPDKRRLAAQDLVAEALAAAYPCR